VTHFAAILSYLVLLGLNGPIEREESMSDERQIEVQVLSDGQKSEAIQIANQEVRRRNFDPAEYRVTVKPVGDSIYVIYIDKEVPVGKRGAKTRFPGVEVEINAEDMQLIRSYFVR
jgi:hypothetical protein